ncbi:MAG: DNA mismatch repair endonuclease MutL [Candidatus Dormibacteraeota bacterium]|nr:DNA mismatch repair endonuclease MutL [Candidatus Dormibacteraeota bacterium]
MSIRLLPQPVADAIAAGEVVERPASVVKELVENALDSRPGRVTVEVRGAGRTLIRVVDDGCGIPPDELELAFARHATSKLATLEDLAAIASLGFRGEALASVAAVADVEARSGGARIRLRGGRVLESGVAMPVPGTVVEVRDLFATTPARLKFLKSDATEAAACLKAVQPYALLYPEVRFEVLMEGRAALRAPGSGELRAAAVAVFGAAVAGELLDVAGEGVTGLVGQPRVSRGTREAILLAANRRPIASRSLGYAVEECYLGALERGRYPITVLDLEVAADALDVNVHPAKREVRFHDERAVFSRVQRGVRAALTGSAPYRLEAAPAAAWPGSGLRSPVLHEAAPLYDASPDTVATPATAASPTGLLRALGQVGEGYLVAEAEDGLVLIDQHAAHERVLFNRFQARLRGAPASSQPLLLPETVELDPLLAAASDDHAERLSALGFDVEPFGAGAVRLRATPAEMPAGRGPEGLRALLQTLVEARPHTVLEEAAASVACHSAVRFGDRLDLSEQRRLLDELGQAPQSITCPHGRPTRLVLDWQTLRRHFRRNY